MILGTVAAMSRFKAVLRAASGALVTGVTKEDRAAILFETRGEKERRGEKAVAYCSAKSARVSAATGRMAHLLQRMCGLMAVAREGRIFPSKRRGRGCEQRGHKTIVLTRGSPWFPTSKQFQLRA